MKEAMEVVRGAHGILSSCHANTVLAGTTQKVKTRWGSFQQDMKALFGQSATLNPNDCPQIMASIASLVLLIAALQATLAATDCQAQPAQCAALSAQIAAAYMQLTALTALASACGC